jgi:ketosteroid isomerase-like protein
MEKEKAGELLDIYGKAWVEQDPDLIISIFTADATYDDPKEPLNYGHEGIRNYWVNKVVNQQKDISFRILNFWATEDAVIAEWEAKFTDTVRNLKIDMREVAIFTVSGERFSSLREYYKTSKVPV